MIYIAGDHFAAELAAKVASHLEIRELPCQNVGSKGELDVLRLENMIPDMAQRLQADVTALGILICGTGTGVEIGANRFEGVRASLCVLPKQAEFARQYDNANVLCLSGWLTDDPAPVVDAFVDNRFEHPDNQAMLDAFDGWARKK